LDDEIGVGYIIYIIIVPKAGENPTLPLEKSVD
jgi:hypothetical protein